MDPMLPPLDGSLLTLIDFVDFNGEHNADRPWLVYPSPSESGQLSSISFAQMVSTTHQIASAIRPARRGSEAEVFAILLHTDSIVYAAIMLGLLRAGFVVSTSHTPIVTMWLNAVSSRTQCHHAILCKVFATCCKARVVIASWLAPLLRLWCARLLPKSANESTISSLSSFLSWAA